ncbi:MAG: PAS domain S-box protein [bacterium]|nr:PAS domain S-box protein [bacterium]
MDLENRKVLIVEDNEEDSLFFQKILNEQGFLDIVLAASGEEAVIKAAELKPNLILMKIELKGELNGIEASIIIRKKIDIPIIFITGLDETIVDYIDDDAKNNCITNSYGFLFKPISEKSFLYSIKIALTRHKFDIKLEESEIKYRELFERSKDPIYIYKNDRFVEFNNSMLELFGYSNEEMTKISLKDICVDLQDIRRFDEAVTEKGYVKDFDLRLLKKDGTTLNCLLTSNILKTKIGEIKGYQGIIRDVTESRKSVERIERSIENMLIAMEKNESLNLSLENKVEDLRDANRTIQLSEERYRLLVEGSSDIIFTLDENWSIISANKSITTLLNIRLEKVILLNFFDLIYDGADEGSVTKDFLKEKLGHFIESREPVQFKIDFKSLISSEPVEVQVRLEYINIEGKNEILGKASRIMEDSLMKYFVSEKQEFSLGNFLNSAEDISHRITRNVKKYMDSKEITLLRIALREIIINSVEHGNLNINFEEKTKVMFEGNYFDFIAVRRLDPIYANKRVVIEYSICPEKVVYKIADEGDGFDHKKIFSSILEEDSEGALPHGRGIMMAKEIFDHIEYNEKGNEVVLVKHFN